MTDAQVAFESFRDWLQTTIIALDEMEQSWPTWPLTSEEEDV